MVDLDRHLPPHDVQQEAGNKGLRQDGQPLIQMDKEQHRAKVGGEGIEGLGDHFTKVNVHQNLLGNVP